MSHIQKLMQNIVCTYSKTRKPDYIYLNVVNFSALLLSAELIQESLLKLVINFQASEMKSFLSLIATQTQ